MGLPGKLVLMGQVHLALRFGDVKAAFWADILGVTGSFSSFSLPLEERDLSPTLMATGIADAHEQLLGSRHWLTAGGHDNPVS